MKKLVLIFVLIPLSICLFSQAVPPVKPAQVGTGSTGDAAKWLVMDANGRGTLSTPAGALGQGLTWLVGGNTLSGDGIFGTSSNHSIIFRTNNTQRLQITPEGTFDFGQNYVKNARISSVSEADADRTFFMWGDRDYLKDAAYIGDVSYELSSGVNAAATSRGYVNNLFDLGGSFVTFLGVTNTSTIKITVDLKQNVDNFSNGYFQPYIIYRYPATVCATFNSLKVETSLDAITWYTSTDVNNIVGTTNSTYISPLVLMNNPYNTWRYIRYTLSNPTTTGSFGTQCWISMLGAKHLNQNIFPSILTKAGGGIWGELAQYAPGGITPNTLLKGDGHSYVSNLSGNFGIGTSSPSEKLDVSGGNLRIRTITTGASTDSTVTVDATGVLKKRTVASLIATHLSVNGIITPTIRLSTGAANGSIAVSDASGNLSWTNPTSITTATPLLSTLVSANPSTGGTLNSPYGSGIGAGISTETYSRWGQTRLRFGLNVGSGADQYSGGNATTSLSGYGGVNLVTADSTRLRVADGGNIGINTLNPVERLHIIGRVRANDLMSSSANSIATEGAYLQWNASSNDGETRIVNQKGGGVGGIRFGSSTTSNVFTEWGRFDQNGNVGIGTTTASEKLTVSGNGTFTGTVTGANATSGGHLLNRTTGDGRYGQLTSDNAWYGRNTFGASNGIEALTLGSTKIYATSSINTTTESSAGNGDVMFDKNTGQMAMKVNFQRRNIRFENNFQQNHNISFTDGADTSSVTITDSTRTVRIYKGSAIATSKVKITLPPPTPTTRLTVLVETDPTSITFFSYTPAAQAILTASNFPTVGVGDVIELWFAFADGTGNSNTGKWYIKKL
jgi:hypothetical protein